MVAPLIAAGARVAATQAAKKGATRGAAKAVSSARGVSNVKKVTQQRVAANDNSSFKINSQASRLRNADNDNLPQGRTTNYVNQHYERGSSNEEDSEEASGGNLKLAENAAHKVIVKETMLLARMVAMFFATIQVFWGLVTIASFGFWYAAVSWTWGLSDYILPNDEIAGGLWAISVTIGLASLITLIVIFSLAGLPIFRNKTTFIGLLLCTGLCLFPATCFVPSGIVFTSIVYFKFH